MSLVRQQSFFQPRSIHMKSFCNYWLPPIFWAAFIFLASSNSDPLYFLSKEGVQFLKHTRFLGQSLLNLTWALSHVFANLVASTMIASREAWRYFWPLPLAFATIHVGYGLGFLVGLFRFAGSW